MSYKLLALDLDDTTLDKNQRLTSRTISMIKRVQASGVMVIIATGRMLISALPYIKQLGLKGPMITYNGAYVKNINSGEVICHRSIKAELAREIIAVVLKNNLHLNLYQDDQLYVVQRNKMVKFYEKIVGIKAQAVGSLYNFVQKDITKLLIIEENRQRHQYYLDLFKKKFLSKINITESKSAFIELMAEGVSKGKALEVLAGKLGFAKEEVIAIGDSWNDLEMIKWAGLGVAMGNSPKGVKLEADLVAPPHDREGVASILEKIFIS